MNTDLECRESRSRQTFQKPYYAQKWRPMRRLCNKFGLRRTRLAALLLIALLSFFCHNIFVGTRTSFQFASPDLAFVVVDVPGKGKGAVAIRNIKQGECLIRETPLFSIPNNVSRHDSVVYDVVNALDQTEQDRFYALSYAHIYFPTDLVPRDNLARLALAIFETNAVDAVDSAAICPIFARLNHGCSRAYNVVYNWRPNEGVQVMHALRDIAKGEELLVPYIDSRKPRKTRREYLSLKFGFTCACEVCTLPDEQVRLSDARLVALADLERQVTLWSTWRMDGPAAIKLLKEMWELSDEEGYWYGRGEIAEDATAIAVAHSDEEAAIQWAELAAEWLGYELGVDSEEALRMQSTVRDPRSHPSWGARDPVRVGLPSK